MHLGSGCSFINKCCSERMEHFYTLIKQVLAFPGKMIRYGACNAKYLCFDLFPIEHFLLYFYPAILSGHSLAAGVTGPVIL